MNHQDVKLRMLMTISKADSTPSQPELAEMLGISLGKTNYCITDLAKNGYIEIKPFKNCNNKIAYAYQITPGGIEEKHRLMARFLSRRLKEYETIRQEIAEISQELYSSPAPMVPAATLNFEPGTLSLAIRQEIAEISQELCASSSPLTEQAEALACSG